MGTIVANMDAMDHATAEAVRKAIRKAGLTESAVAKGAKIPPSTWYRRMKGRRSFYATELMRVAHVLGIRPGEIVDPVAEKIA